MNCSYQTCTDVVSFLLHILSCIFLYFSSCCTSISEKAFGVGAPEEDDDDIFSQESVNSYHTSLALPSDNEQPAKYGWTGGKEMGGGSSDAYQ